VSDKIQSLTDPEIRDELLGDAEDSDDVAKRLLEIDELLATGVSSRRLAAWGRDRWKVSAHVIWADIRKVRARRVKAEHATVIERKAMVRASYMQALRIAFEKRDPTAARMVCDSLCRLDNLWSDNVIVAIDNRDRAPGEALRLELDEMFKRLTSGEPIDVPSKEIK
jgi:hypothetical protein